MSLKNLETEREKYLAERSSFVMSIQNEVALSSMSQSKLLEIDQKLKT